MPMTMPENSADEICKRMAELRRELTHDVQDVSRSAKAMTSPSYYVKKFPWATLAVAAGIGYMLIPKRKPAPPANMEELAELLRKNQLNASTMKAEESPGVVKTLAVMGLTWAARAGMNYIVDQLTTVATNAAAKAKAPSEASSPAADEPTDVNV